MAGFQQAKREQIWLKILCGGASGSGKTYSSLRLAKGITSKTGGKIAAIDTENGRIRYYANEFDFDDLRLEAPYSPEKYIEAIELAVRGGYKVLIIDSITHEWDYCLDQHSKMPGNSYTNWAKITPKHDSFMEKILQSPIHIICTVRGKDEYVMEEKNGKQVPKKVGLGYKQRDNTEYNYTVTFNIDQQNHIADATKDNTHLFENKYEVLTEVDGEKLFNWANSGDAPKVQPKTNNTVFVAPNDGIPNIPVNEEEIEKVVDIKDIIAKINKIAKEKSEKNRPLVIATIKEDHPTGNPNGIKDISVANTILNKLENLEV